MLSDEQDNLRKLLNQIECANMVIVNFFFKNNVLPVNGFGYLVPTKENSPILGCIFDSVFNRPDQKGTTLTTMLGGAWYDKFIGDKNPTEIYDMAFAELRRHLGLNSDPDANEVTILKNAIPQYRVGHQELLKQIQMSIVENGLEDRLFLTGNSYDGLGVNDTIFNARKLVQEVISKRLTKTN